MRAKETYEQEMLIQATMRKSSSTNSAFLENPSLLRAIRANSLHKSDLLEEICTELIHGMTDPTTQEHYKTAAWESTLKDICKTRYHGCFPSDPFAEVDLFVDLPIHKQVLVIYHLILWKCEEDEILRDYIKSSLPGSWRMNCIGVDRDGNRFWYFKDHRLYIEQALSSDTISTRHSRSMKEPDHWEIHCETRHEWDDALQKWKSSTYAEEKALFAALNEQESQIEEALRIKAKSDKKYVAAAALPARKSTRIESKFIQELQLEQMRIEAEFRAIEESKRISQMVAAADQSPAKKTSGKETESDNHIAPSEQSPSKDLISEKERIAMEREIIQVERTMQRQQRQQRYQRREEVKQFPPFEPPAFNQSTNQPAKHDQPSVQEARAHQGSQRRSSAAGPSHSYYTSTSSSSLSSSSGASLSPSSSSASTSSSESYARQTAHKPSTRRTSTNQKSPAIHNDSTGSTTPRSRQRRPIPLSLANISMNQSHQVTFVSTSRAAPNLYPTRTLATSASVASPLLNSWSLPQQQQQQQQQQQHQQQHQPQDQQQQQSKSPSQLFQEIFLTPLVEDHRSMAFISDEMEGAEDVTESEHVEADVDGTGGVQSRKRSRPIRKNEIVCPFDTMDGFPPHVHITTPVARMRPPFHQSFPSIYTPSDIRRMVIDRPQSPSMEHSARMF
eukprot:TRINITY_DN4504_c0_g1_i3.p1 TRINITY_DN4504_c0_g1~~TRINITY_DN4504_c0_g1_i3.p1  ORF type:complete len:674 (-),score=139.24 TRINITY_DN4504_c0_g1_i3:310-2331(-)